MIVNMTAAPYCGPVAAKDPGVWVTRTRMRGTRAHEQMHMVRELMHPYHFRFGRYPSTWDVLVASEDGAKTVYGWRVETAPRASDGSRWAPDTKSGVVLYIRRADESGFLVEAVDDLDGRVVLDLDETMVAPRELAAVRCPCNRGVTQEQEPVEILRRAVNAIEEKKRLGHSCYVTAWGRLGLHYSFEPHTIAMSPGVPMTATMDPPADTVSEWRPRGSVFTYRLTASRDEGFRIESSNEAGYTDYYITKLMARRHEPPQPLPK
jgi:hypothetical protein